MRNSPRLGQRMGTTLNVIQGGSLGGAATVIDTNTGVIRSSLILQPSSATEIVSAIPAEGFPSTASNPTLTGFETEHPQQTQQSAGTNNPPESHHSPYIISKVIPALGGIVGFLVILVAIVWSLQRRKNYARRSHEIARNMLARVNSPSTTVTERLLEAAFGILASNRSVAIGMDEEFDIARRCSAVTHERILIRSMESILAIGTTVPVAEDGGQNPEVADGTVADVSVRSVVGGLEHEYELGHPGETMTQQGSSADTGRYAEPSAIEAVEPGRQTEERDDTEVGASRLIRPRRWSRRGRNMSISSGSIATTMSEPPPPYSTDEPFNPAEFDLSQVTPRRMDLDSPEYHSTDSLGYY